MELAQQWITDFWSANHDIKWLAVEEEVILWLDEHTALVGRVDARGHTASGDLFFGEWKTLSAYKGRYITDEKIKWRRDPQALTYALFNPDSRRFTVRWAIKPQRDGQPVTTAFEWYTYEPWELEWWLGQLLSIASSIRLSRERLVPPWRTNVTNCYRYGIKYQCPFLPFCPDQPDMQVGEPRVPHLTIEPQLRAQHTGDPQLVVLDASRVDDYLGCPESYRRKWEGRGTDVTSEAIVIGKDFHAIVAAHIKDLMKGNNP